MEHFLALPDFLSSGPHVSTAGDATFIIFLWKSAVLGGSKERPFVSCGQWDVWAELVSGLPDESMVMKSGGMWRLPRTVPWGWGLISVLPVAHSAFPHPSPKQKSLDLCCQQKEGFMRFKCVGMVEGTLGLAFHVLPHHRKSPTKKAVRLEVPTETLVPGHCRWSKTTSAPAAAWSP